MPRTAPGFPDWRDGDAYRPLLEVEKAGHAWEWLRRDPSYQAAMLEALDRGAAAGRVEPKAASWGLHGFEDFRMGIGSARPCWRAEDFPLVLKGELGDMDAGPDAVALGRLIDEAHILSDARGDRILLADGRRSLRIDLDGAWRRGVARRIRWRIEGLGDAQPGVQLIRRLIGFSRRRVFVPALHPPHYQARRLVMMLRSYDGWLAGARQRDVAAHVLGGPASEARWRIETPSLRSQAQRLVRNARALAADGWRLLLRE